MKIAIQTQIEIEKQVKNCSIKTHSIMKFFKLIQNQQNDYSDFQYAGNGAFAFVLKSTNQKTNQIVALKVIECDKEDSIGMEMVEQEYDMLRQFSNCKYIVQVNKCFYLTENYDYDDDNQDARRQENQIQNQENVIKVFFVIEQEFCQTNLDTYFIQCRKSNNYPSDQIKEIMMIQMLDSIAYLHRFDVVHRDIKPSNFLLSFDQNGQPVVKLCDLSFATALKNNESRIYFSKFQGTQSYSAPEVDRGIFKKASDMFSLGLVLLELDNISTFDFIKTTNEQKFDIKFGSIFTSFQINRQSQIYNIASQCLQFDPKNRISPVDLLIQFILQNQNYLDVEISSILNKKQLQKKAEQLSQIQRSIIENSKKQENELLQYRLINQDLKFEKLIQEFQMLKYKPFEIFECQIILEQLSKKTQFDSNFEFISVGANGLILGVYNQLYKRHSALKIQRVSSKQQVILEVGIIRDCQMPLVIKFYDFFYLNVRKEEDFVVYEVEKCSGNLKQYFNRLKKDKIQLTDEEKMQIAIQVIDVINYLHYHDIVHRDIKLENILYIDSQSQVPIIKLTIVFVALIAFSVALIDDSTMTGGWYNYKFSNGFQSDNSNPLTKVFKKLSAELQGKGISGIQFTSVTSQVVNGQNFKIKFAYTQNDSAKTGYCFAYVSFSGETCEIHGVELEMTPLAQGKEIQNGGWSNYTIPSNFEQDATNPLNMAMVKLSNQLMSQKMTFVKFISIQSQVVAGQRFRIQFELLNKNGQKSIGKCVAYVRSWENFVEVSELSISSPLQMSVEENQNGGWSTYNFSTSELQNETSVFGSAYSELVNTLLKKSIKVVSVSRVEKQVVSGINFKISFIYSENNSLKFGKATVYVQEWTKTIEISSLELTGQVIKY
ncbi:hypothetical protein ABPG73_007743 [Tetrahymena malaccensis]